MTFKKAVLLAALVAAPSRGFSFQQVQQQPKKTTTKASRNEWAAFPVGLALALAVVQPSEIFDPFDFSSGPYLQPEKRIVREQPRVPDVTDLVQSQAKIQSAASLAIAKERFDSSSVLQSSEVSPAAPPKKAATLALIGNKMGVPDEGELLPKSALVRPGIQRSTHTRMSPNKMSKVAPVPKAVAKAAATSSEVSTAPPRMQQKKTKSTMASMAATKQKTTRKFSASVPDEGQLMSKSTLASRSVSKASQPVQKYPKKIQATPVPTIVAKAAATSSEVTAAPPRIQQQKTKSTMASMAATKQKTQKRSVVPDEGQFLPATKQAPRVPSAFVPDEGQLLSQSMLASRSLPLQSQPVSPQTISKAAPVPIMVAKAAASSSEVLVAPPKRQQLKTKSTMASMTATKQKPQHRTASSVVMDEGQLISASSLSASSSIMASEPVQMQPKTIQAPPVSSLQARAALTSSEVSF